jgi:hypothetical protein
VELPGSAAHHEQVLPMVVNFIFMHPEPLPGFLIKLNSKNQSWALFFKPRTEVQQNIDGFIFLSQYSLKPVSRISCYFYYLNLNELDSSVLSFTFNTGILCYRELFSHSL